MKETAPIPNASILLKPMLSTKTWLELPIEIRQKLRQTFNLPRSGGSMVSQSMINGKVISEVISDGTTISDLAHLTLEKLQEFTESEDVDYFKLLNDTVKKLGGKELPQETQTATTPILNPSSDAVLSNPLGEQAKDVHNKVKAQKDKYGATQNK